MSKFSPYGYEYARDRIGVERLVPVPEEQEVIRVIRALREAGLSYDRIAHELHERGEMGRDGWFTTALVTKICKREARLDSVPK